MINLRRVHSVLQTRYPLAKALIPARGCQFCGFYRRQLTVRVKGLGRTAERHFSTDKAKPEDGEMIKKKHESEINRKLNRLMKGEIFPILLLTACGVLGYIFWDNLLNLLNLNRVSDPEIRSIARKVATFKKYSHIKEILDSERIENELVEEVYKEILQKLSIKGLKTEVVVYMADEMEMTLLPNGALFISDTLLNAIDDVRQLVLLILRHLELLRMKALQVNLSKKVKYGDFRRQYLFFKMKYTGYDVLFIDYLTNMRYTLNQVAQADSAAIEIMKNDLGIPLPSSGAKSFKKQYRDLMYKIGKDKEEPEKEIDPILLQKLQEFTLIPEDITKPKNPELKPLLSALEASAQKYNQMIMKEEQEKEVAQKRDYEIYDQMNYKLAERKYHLSELFPIGNDTISRVDKAIEADTEDPTARIDMHRLKQIFNDWKSKDRRLRKFNS
ncbi:unnamed protein product [Moneuplotes crassus]|uniref:Uncharacterized protein n=1 Tax=Euplotes crassus TaxID=5936 RepID=A0AAD1UGK0_EUPCR|nr:unnamed protein product [Moneuplotes crassus]